MDQIIITPRNEQEFSFVKEFLKRMKIQATTVKEKPMRPMTMEEFNAEIDAAEEDIRAGRVISHKEMGKRIASW